MKAKLVVNEFVDHCPYEVWLEGEADWTDAYDRRSEAEAHVARINRPRDPEIERAMVALQTEGYGYGADTNDPLDSHHPDYQD